MRVTVKSLNSNQTDLPNRREILSLGIAATGTLVTVGAGLAASTEQMSDSTMIKNLINVLRSIGKDVCLSVAAELEATEGLNPTVSLHLRNAGLDLSDAQLLANALFSLSLKKDQPVRSFSVSHNSLIGDSGTVALIESLPLTVSEIGFVGCNIGDEGGRAIIEWANNSARVSMICVEANKFSSNLHTEFQKLRENRPGLQVIA